MPVRIPAARGSETAIIGMAGTARWAPRWERNISRFAAPAERLAQRAEPRIARTVRRVENRLPLEKMAQNVDRRIKKGVDRMGMTPKA